jgi:hypothetical protein
VPSNDVLEAPQLDSSSLPSDACLSAKVKLEVSLYILIKACIVPHQELRGHEDFVIKGSESCLSTLESISVVAIIIAPCLNQYS